MAPSQLTCQTRIGPQLLAKTWETKTRSNLECTIPEAILPGLRQNADISSREHWSLSFRSLRGRSPSSAFLTAVWSASSPTALQPHANRRSLHQSREVREGCAPVPGSPGWYRG